MRKDLLVLLLFVALIVHVFLLSVRVAALQKNFDTLMDATISNTKAIKNNTDTLESHNRSLTSVAETLRSHNHTLEILIGKK